MKNNPQEPMFLGDTAPIPAPGDQEAPGQAPIALGPEERLTRAESLLVGHDWQRNVYEYFGLAPFKDLDEADKARIEAQVKEELELLLSHWSRAADRQDRLSALQNALARAKTNLINPGQKKAFDASLERILLSGLGQEISERLVPGTEGRRALPLRARQEILRRLETSGLISETRPGSLQKMDKKVSEELARQGGISSNWKDDFRMELDKLPATSKLDNAESRSRLTRFLEELCILDSAKPPALDAVLTELGFSLQSPRSAFAGEVLGPMADARGWKTSQAITAIDFGILVGKAAENYGLIEADVEDILTSGGYTILRSETDNPLYSAWKKAVHEGKPLDDKDRLLGALAKAAPDHRAIQTFGTIKAALDKQALAHTKLAEARGRALLLVGIASFFLAAAVFLLSLVASLPLPFLFALILGGGAFYGLAYQGNCLPGRFEPKDLGKEAHAETLKALEKGLDPSLLQGDLSRQPSILHSAIALLAGFAVVVLLLSTANIGWLLNNPHKARSGATEILLPAATFRMGSEKSGFPDQGPRHKVILTKPIWVKVTETSQKEWAQIMRPGKAVPADQAELPAVNLNWWEALAYCNALSEKEGLKQVYGLSGIPSRPRLTSYQPEAGGWRLPTEAEWEYIALRACTWKGDRFSGTNNPKRAGIFSPASAPINVLEAPSNPLGIRGLNGNVWEWCFASYGTYPSGLEKDPGDITLGEQRLLRGGSFMTDLDYGTNTYRNPAAPSAKGLDIGLRLVRSPGQKGKP